jgi:hypothetical protein
LFHYTDASDPDWMVRHCYLLMMHLQLNQWMFWISNGKQGLPLVIMHILILAIICLWITIRNFALLLHSVGVMRNIVLKTLVTYLGMSSYPVLLISW